MRLLILVMTSSLLNRYKVVPSDGELVDPVKAILIG